MKTKSIFSILTSAFLFFTFIATAENLPTPKTNMPDDVEAIVKKSCFGCHNTASKNEDGKKALDFKKLEDLSKIKQISAYKEISDVMEEGEMPPKKFIQRNPEKKLSSDEVKRLIAWSKKEAEALVKGE
jgi:hypothetical protein